ncbi:anthocyanidin 3-O-glucoside 2'''-O-xylosyltransferase-like [Chenopodium quinoa]|uniref:Glycosyltransferase n=1 Tax=Chenopodium quinoa TaxID=63459 RepID=A0A803MBP6_CHEQI|nr:anthocyanidin 3-O-glucoside 2'''-O-xylosyltransferase-like [Chenopodium quinoa]
MEEKQLNILMYPWIAMGHITPYFHLAIKLTERGHKVTLLLPNKAKLQLQSLNHNYSPLLTFHTITIPQVDPLPPGTETASDVPFHLHTHLATAFDLTRPQVGSIVSTLQPDLVFYDFAHWVPEVVSPGTKYVVYVVVSSAALAFGMVPSRDPPKDRAAIEEDNCVVNVPHGYPSTKVVLEPRRMLGLYVPLGEGLTLYDRVTTALKRSHVIAIRTCQETEGKYCDYLSSQYNNKPVLFSGPVLPDPEIEGELEGHWAKWLNQFRPNSLVYCSFGSQFVLEVAQFQELLLGLEMTNLPFLVAVKPPTGCATVEEAFPEGFVARTKERGVVTGEWVQQRLILNHASVGCFVSHCGFGSMWESLLSENQIVLIPQLEDQVLNTKIMVEELKVAVEVEKGEDGSWVSKESFCNAIKCVMDDGSEIGGLIKKNHMLWRQILGDPKFMSGYIDKFIKDLQGLVG